jgi:3',5'-nucleoside bisphosphate phosphatase
LIDLHSHTTESDGTSTPEQLIETAIASGLEALAITDHDTFSGYDAAMAPARDAGFELVCGIELSTKLQSRTVHLLAYFVGRPPSPEFREWLGRMQASRRDRNRRLAARLQALGLDITLEEVEARGRNMTGRPHFARVMVEKGHVASIQDAFDEYLDESAKGYVDREEPTLAEGIQRVISGGGIPSIAHPIRLPRAGEDMNALTSEMRDMGLQAIEAYHSDHRPSDVALYLGLAERYGLAVTGGSDFHGEVRPAVRLGSGVDGNLSVPYEVLDRLRSV